MDKSGEIFFTGAKKKGFNYPPHHPKFDIDERVLSISTKMLLAAYYEYQNLNGSEL